MSKEDVIKEFTSLKGVGKAKAELLYKNGFDSLEKLKRASVKNLEKVSGINEKFAINLKNQLKESGEKPKKKDEKIKTKKPEKKEEEKLELKDEEEIEVVEDQEKKYQTKKKPDIDKKKKEQLIKRKKIKNRTPDFLREEWFRYKRIPKNWRRPDGITSKMRINLKYRPNKVRVGFRGPKEIRGLHPSGFEEVIVYNAKDIKNINSKTQAIRIGSTVGTKKRIEIEKKAEELDIRILNM
ncbi:MAG: 50S ribosomal protein L32e [Thermoplasmatales archaeon]|nr:MAG: 50S ribosomal protein L32e [Thermoplasmatales archaeon]